MTNTAYGHDLRSPRDELAESLRGASATPFWLDTQQQPAAIASLPSQTDLLIVGGGFCGLWTALMAKEREPQRDVVLIEAHRIAWAASGRNGGFLEASLTHGMENGERHFASELDAIERLAASNFEEFKQTLRRYNIDAELEEEGVLSVATEPHQVQELRLTGATVLEGRALATLTKSPVARAGVFTREDVGLVNPVKLARGLRDACLSLGVQIFENTRALGLENAGSTVGVTTPSGRINARRVALATNGFPSLLRRNVLRTVPIYDYVLVTEPLTDTQLDDIGWRGRYGITDLSRQFHYYRKTADNRILWGGYDAVYHRGRRIKPEYDQRPETFERLADHFFTTYPTLRGTHFTHAWGGMIDMSTKFVAFQGTALRGKVAYSSGYTGLGVGTTRFGASVMLDLLGGEQTARTALAFATTKPFPIPPEPIAYPTIQVMRRAIAKSDRNGGNDGLLIRTMQLFGIGFDS
ncbi:NAD(P)/FAD-dependent oxidoreductase [Subtercola lobariae]|uniref:Oxidoreductase n=1 Tax=Subtercola lobariae TaxID=1588641 RepID=A0A917B506_9MICO|nr:FAD-binding oxidoreductase [Subtercola lobariae]GGF19317.1 oxidoreductase [Subtercola lobariae]